MCPNYNLIPAIIIGFLLYYAGLRLSKRMFINTQRWLMGVLFFVLCLPALSFILYYAHILGEPLWYIEFRSIDYIEVLSAMWGLFFGFVFAGKPMNKYLRLQWPVICIVFIFIPFAKSWLMPPEILGTVMQDNWDNGVCMQTTHSTCGPASLATVMNGYKIPVTERQLAIGCYTAVSGTEIWYIIRYARNHGMRVNIQIERDIQQVSVPAILGVRISKIYGHFIVLLDNRNGNLVIGDPAVGRRNYSIKDFKKRYGFNGFAVTLDKE